MCINTTTTRKENLNGSQNGFSPAYAYTRSQNSLRNDLLQRRLQLQDRIGYRVELRLWKQMQQRLHQLNGRGEALTHFTRPAHLPILTAREQGALPQYFNILDDDINKTTRHVNNFFRRRVTNKLNDIFFTQRKLLNFFFGSIRTNG